MTNAQASARRSIRLQKKKAKRKTIAKYSKIARSRGAKEGKIEGRNEAN